MKIIKVDNFDREIYSDKLIATSLSDFYAKRIANLLNDNEDPQGPDYYRAVQDDHTLFKFEP